MLPKEKVARISPQIWPDNLAQNMCNDERRKMTQSHDVLYINVSYKYTDHITTANAIRILFSDMIRCGCS